MADKTITVTLRAQSDFSSVVGDVSKLKANLEKLKLPNFDTDFAKHFSTIDKELTNIQAQLNKGFQTKADVTAVEKAFKNIDKEFINLSKKVGTIDFKEALKNFKVDDSILRDFDNKIQQVKNNAVKAFSEIKIGEGISKNISDDFKNIDTSTLKKKISEVLSSKGAKSQTSIDNFFNAASLGNLKEAETILKRLSASSSRITNVGLKQAYSEVLPVMQEVLEQAGKIEDISGAQKSVLGLQAEKDAIGVKLLSAAMEDVNKSTAGVQKNARAVGEGIRDIGEASLEANHEVEELTSRFRQFFTISNAIQIFKRGIRDAFNTVKELDEVMTQTAVVTDFTVSDMWDQLPKYTKQANQLGVATKGVYEAMTLYYQQGLNTNQSLALATETLKMARIANLDYATSTDYMTAAIRGFNMALNETSATRVNDVYSELAAVTAADTEEIAVAMTKVASIANSANMEFENTAAFLAQIIETTRESPETAGTALKTIIARFAEVKKLYSAGELLGTDEEGEEINVNNIQKALRSVGISMTDFLAGNEGLDDVLLRLAEKWDSLDTITQRYIATQAAGSRQQSRFLAMMSDYSRTVELTNAAYNSAGSSQEQFEKTLDSLDAKLNQLKNSWDSFILGITDSDVIKGAVDALTGLLNVINGITDALGSSSGIAKIGLALGAFTVGKGILQGAQAGYRAQQTAMATASTPAAGMAEFYRNSPQGIMGYIGQSVKGTLFGGAAGFGDWFNQTYRPERAWKNKEDALKREHIEKKTQELEALDQKIRLEDENIKTAETQAEILKKSAEAARENAERNFGTSEEISSAVYAEVAQSTSDNADFQASQAKQRKANLEKERETIEFERNNFKAPDLTEEQKIESATAAYNRLSGAVTGVGAGISMLGMAMEKSAEDGTEAAQATAEAVSEIGGAVTGVGAAMQMLGPIVKSIAPTLMGPLAIIGVALAAVLAIGTALDNYNEFNTVESQLERVNNKITETESEIENLKSSWEALGQAQDNLDGLVVGTNEWNAALQDVNSQVLALIENFPELAQYMSVGSDGRLSISQAGYEVALQQREDSLKDYETESANLDFKKVQIDQKARDQLYKDLQRFGYDFIRNWHLFDDPEIKGQMDAIMDAEIGSQADVEAWLLQYEATNGFASKEYAAALQAANKVIDPNDPIYKQLFDVGSMEIGQLENFDYNGLANVLINQYNLDKELVDVLITESQKLAEERQSQIANLPNEVEASFSNDKVTVTQGFTYGLKRQELLAAGGSAKALDELIAEESDNLSPERFKEFLDVINTTDFSDKKSVEQTIKTLEELGLASAGVKDFLNGLIDAGVAIETWSKETFTKELASLEELQKDLEGREEGDRTFTKEQYEKYLQIDPSLKDDFVWTGADEFTYVGNSLDILSDVVLANTTALIENTGALTGELQRAENIERVRAKSSGYEIWGTEATPMTREEAISKMLKEKDYTFESGQFVGVYRAPSEEEIAQYIADNPEYTYTNTTSEDIIKDLQSGEITIVADNWTEAEQQPTGKFITLTEAKQIAKDFGLTDEQLAEYTTPDALLKFLVDYITSTRTPEEIEKDRADAQQLADYNTSTIYRQQDALGTNASWAEEDAIFGVVGQYTGDNMEQDIDILRAQAYEVGVSTEKIEAFNRALEENNGVLNRRIAAMLANEIEDKKTQKSLKKTIDEVKKITDKYEDLNEITQEDVISIGEALGFEDIEENSDALKVLAENMDLVEAAMSGDIEAMSQLIGMLSDAYGITIDATTGRVDFSALLKAEQDVQAQTAALMNALIQAGSFETEEVEVETSGHYPIPVFGPNGYITGFQEQYYSAGQTMTVVKPTSAPNIKAASGGGGGGGGGGGNKSYKPDYDRYYNLTEEINETKRDRNDLEREYEELLKQESATALDLLKVSNQQLVNLAKERALQEQLLEGRKWEVDNVLNEMFENEDTEKSFADWGVEQYANYDYEAGVINIDWDAIQQITDASLGAAVDEYVKRLEELKGQVEDVEDDIDDIEDAIEEIEERNKQEYLDFEQKVFEAIVERQQKMIDNFSDLSDSIDEQNNNILTALQEAIDLERQIRDNTKTEEEITDAEARLAYLRRDTSGANDQEILQLEEELRDMRESYQDTLVDQSLEKLTRANEEAAQQREKQIEIAQAQLDYAAENGEFWEQVSSLIESAFNDDGTLNNNSALVGLLKETDGFKGMSYFGKENWWQEFVKELKMSNEGYSNWQVSTGKSSASGIELSDGTRVKWDNDQKKWISGTWDEEKQEWTSTGAEYTGISYDIKNGVFTGSKVEATKVKIPETTPAENPPSTDDYTPTYKGKTYEQWVAQKNQNTDGYKNYIKWRDTPGRVYKAGNHYNFNIGSIGSWSGYSSERGAAAALSQKRNEGMKPYIGNFNSYTEAEEALTHFKTGGLNTTTGPAWLDGTKSRPEYVLNAVQTQAFLELTDILPEFMKHNSLTTNSNTNGDIYFDIKIEVAEIASDYDVDQLAARVKEQIYENSTYRNVNSINFIR